MKRDVNATQFERIPTVPKDAKKRERLVHAIVETCKDSPHKYALKPEYGLIEFSGVLPSGMHWPYDFGFVPQTLGDDGDPLDIVIITQHGLFSGCLVEARILGCVKELQDGVRNDRLIAALKPSSGAPQPSDEYNDISDIAESLIKEIADFLCSYSERQGHTIEFDGVCGAADAMKRIEAGMKLYKKKRG